MSERALPILRAAVAALGGLFVLGLAAAHAQPPAAAEGKRLYMSDGCYECHGTTGEGGGSVAPKLAPDPLPMEAFAGQLRHPRGRMPAYSPAVMSDAQITDILAYLQTIPPGPTAARIPLLNH